MTDYDVNQRKLRKFREMIKDYREGSERDLRGI